MQFWGRWNKRTKQLAPLGAIIGVTPYLYVTAEEAFKKMVVGEELVVEVILKHSPFGYAQIGGEALTIEGRIS